MMSRSSIVHHVNFPSRLYFYLVIVKVTYLYMFSLVPSGASRSSTLAINSIGTTIMKLSLTQGMVEANSLATRAILAKS